MSNTQYFAFDTTSSSYRPLYVLLGVLGGGGIITGIVLLSVGSGGNGPECPVGEWVDSNAYYWYEKRIGSNVQSRKACVDLVARECPDANIANYGKNDKGCWCQYESASIDTIEVDGEDDYETCRMSTEKAKIPWRLFCGRFNPADVYNDTSVKMCEIPDGNFINTNYVFKPGVSTPKKFQPMSNFQRDVEQLEVSDVENFDGVLSQNDLNFKNIDLSGWNVENGKIFEEMFDACSFNITGLSAWNVGNGENFRYMFRKGPIEGDINQNDFSSWNVEKGKDFEGMFYGRKKFENDLSTWDVGNGENFANMFYFAEKFESDLSAWDVSAGTDFRNMFTNAAILTSNNKSSLENWDVCNAVGNFDSQIFTKVCN